MAGQQKLSTKTPGGWPYPSYADRRWLGGERGHDPALSAVVRAVRATAHDSTDLPSGLAQLAAIKDRVDWALLSLVGEARANGMSWQAIGDALGVSKQAAQQRYSTYVNEAMEQAKQRAKPAAVASESAG